MHICMQVFGKQTVRFLTCSLYVIRHATSPSHVISPNAALRREKGDNFLLAGPTDAPRAMMKWRKVRTRTRTGPKILLLPLGNSVQREMYVYSIS